MAYTKTNTGEQPIPLETIQRIMQVLKSKASEYLDDADMADIELMLRTTGQENKTEARKIDEANPDVQGAMDAAMRKVGARAILKSHHAADEHAASLGIKRPKFMGY